ncbi:MAG: TldD/PmbA family protein [Pseudomonadota bacterium]
MRHGDELLSLARGALRLAHEAGAEEAGVSVGTGVSVELSQRDGRLEQATESRTLSLSLRLLVDGRFSSHGTADMRPEAVEVFVRRAVAATRLLEPDRDRALPPAEACGEAEGVELDLWDDAQAGVDPDERKAALARFEQAVLARRDAAPLRSATVYLGDSRSESATLFSNGFESVSRGTSFGLGASLTLEEEGGKLPEASCGHGAAHQADLPGAAIVADELWVLGLRRLGARPAPSGRYPMLLEHYAVGRLLGMLLGPMGGAALHYGRSCLAGKLGERIGGASFTLRDEPLLPRGPGSRLADGDGFPARPRALVAGGVLQTYLLSQYFARKLGMAPTTGSTSNVVLPPGPRAPLAIAADLPRAIRVESFLGGNANSTTGDFSFGVRGTLLEHGQEVQSVAEMNIAGNLFEVLERFAEAAADVHRHGTYLVPSVLFDDIQFSGV